MQFKHIVAATSIAVFAMGAQATSSIEVSVSDFGASSAGGFSWLTQSVGAGITLQDQLGWSSPTQPTVGPFVNTYAFGSTSLTSANGAFGSVDFTNTGYNIKLTTPSTGAHGWVDLDVRGTFTLAANSSVTFAWYRTATGTNAGAATPNFDFTFTNQLQLLTSGTVNGFHVEAPPVYNEQAVGTTGSFSISSPSTYQGMTYTNSGTDAVTAEFYGNVHVYSRDAVPFTTAVPEPEGYALVLAGLLTVGFLSRKRKG